MATFSKVPLSGATMGGISIVSTATAIHTTSVSSSIIDEVWVYAANHYDNDVEIILTDGYWQIQNTIPSKTGLALLVPGLIFYGNNTVGASIEGSIGNYLADGYVFAFGYVNRITP